jgi:hypothetical protein
LDAASWSYQKQVRICKVAAITRALIVYALICCSRRKICRDEDEGDEGDEGEDATEHFFDCHSVDRRLRQPRRPALQKLQNCVLATAVCGGGGGGDGEEGWRDANR